MSANPICFVKSLAPDQEIRVLDVESADRLSRILAQLDEKWTRSDEVVIAPKAATAAPVAQPVEWAAAPASAETPAKPREFRVILISGTSTFRCSTCDMSLEEARLKKAAPPSFCGKDCVAYISHDDMRENVEVSCQVINDESGIARVQFRAREKRDLALLSQWISDRAS